MTPLFHPYLVNGGAGDPVVYVDCLFERRALLFDLGDVTRLPPRKILRLTHLFVSHTHVDHFIGFDQLLRIALGRGRDWHLFGPPGFTAQVGHKLAAYTWNLVDSYDTDFVIRASEYHWERNELRGARFRLKARFEREDDPPQPSGGVLLDEETFRVRAVALDHRIPSLAFALEEKLHLNIWKTRLTELGLPTGPWLRELKQAIRRGAPDDAPITIRWRDRHGEHQHVLALGQLRAEVVRVASGQKIAFVVDTAYSETNAERIVDLAADADVFFCESVFLERDAAQAAAKAHLTAGQAGLLARRARAKRLVPMHFSARYADEGDVLEREAQAAFVSG